MPRGRLPKKGLDYYLPKETYRMVQHFCLSYKELKLESLNIKSLRSPTIDDMPHGTGVSNPTEKEGIRLAEIERKLSIIERAVAETADSKCLFLAVTEGKSYRELRDTCGCPYGHNQFGQLKRMVYWKVSKEI